MSSTTSLHKTWPKISVFCLFFLGLSPALAQNEFVCLKSIQPFTETIPDSLKFYGKLRISIDKNALILPRVSKDQVQGFVLFTEKAHGFYSKAQILGESSKPLTIATLPEIEEGELLVYKFVVQPDGLETVTLGFVPGIKFVKKAPMPGTAMGTTMLPLLGFFVSSGVQTISDPYWDPLTSGLDEEELKERRGRYPSSNEKVKAIRIVNASLLEGPMSSEETDSLLTQLLSQHLDFLNDRQPSPREYDTLLESISAYCQELPAPLDEKVKTLRKRLKVSS